MFDCLNCEVFFRVFVFFELCSILFAGLFDRALGAEIEPHARTYEPMTRRRAVPILLRSRKSILKDEEKNVFLAVTNNESEFKPTDLLLTIVIRRVKFILKCNSFFLIDYF